MDLSKLQERIKIAYTLGDIAGIGPEIFEKFTNELALSPYKDLIEIILIDDLLDFEIKKQFVKMGEPSEISGEHSISTLIKANELALKNEIDFLVTGPVSKESLHMAGDSSSGQTEFLAKLNGLNRDEVEMFFACGDFLTVLATRHVAIKDVSEELKLKFRKTITNSIHALKKVFNITNPNIAVAGLNPHCGENGLIGKEELEFMGEEIENLNKEFSSTYVSKVQAADSLFAQAGQEYLQKKKQSYDLYVAAYHDQALPVIKTVAGFNAVNLTVGLPYVRVSVDHGTAFEIVGKNKASSESLKACTEFCLKLAEIRKGVALFGNFG